MVLSKPGSPAADPERGPDKPFSSASEMDLDGYHGWASWKIADNSDYVRMAMTTV